MSSRIGLVTVAVAVLSLSLRAHAQAPQQPTTYQVDTNTSHVFVKVGSASLMGHEHGVQGQLSSGSVALNGSGSLVFNMKTFIADTPAARQYVGLDPNSSASDAQKVTANMLGSEVLDVNNYPTAVYTVTAFTPADGQKAGAPGTYQVDGRFTLHGTTRPVQFRARIDPTDQPGVLRMVGSFTILQSSYGIKPYSALGGLARVADPLQIWGDLLLVPAR